MKRCSLLSAIGILVLGVLMCPAQTVKESPREYIIYSNDVLEISVYQEPDLSVSVRVSQDGTINFPLLGNIQAAGLSERQLEKSITDLLTKDYLVNPQVSVFVKEYAKISILGQVRSPGSYETKESFSLTQAIALAGGFTETANINKVKIMRTIGDKKETLIINVADIMNKAGDDIQINANDVLIVEGYGMLSIMGQVKTPGSYTIKENLTLTQAIALAGGFSETANTKSVKIIRSGDNRKETFTVDVQGILKGEIADVELEPDDTIIVEEEKLGRISIIGQVVRPGVYNLKPGLTVVEAISSAGGFTSTAAQDGTKIIRTQDGRRAAIQIRISDIIKGGDESKDLILQDGDTIVVPESFF